MVYLSDKKKKNVQTVEKQKQTPTEAVSEEQPQEDVVETPFEVPKIPDKAKNALKELGFDISGIDKAFETIVGWAGSVELRFKAIQEEMPQQVANKLIEIAQKRRQEAMAKLQASGGTNMPQGQGGGLGGIGTILQAIAPFLGGGGSSDWDEEMKNLSKDLLRAQITRMKQDMGFTEAVKNAIVSKIAAKATTDIIG